MSDDPPVADPQMIRADIDVSDARPGMPAWERVAIAVCTAFAMLIVVVLLVGGLIMLRQQEVARDTQSAHDSQVAALRERVEVAESALQCREDLALDNVRSQMRAQRQVAELIIRVAGEFDRALRLEPTNPDSVHTQVEITRTALDDADRALEAWAAAYIDCH